MTELTHRAISMIRYRSKGEEQWLKFICIFYLQQELSSLHH